LNEADIVVLDQDQLAKIVYDVMDLAFPDKRGQVRMALT
jgi:hypothetical protein